MMRLIVRYQICAFYYNNTFRILNESCELFDLFEPIQDYRKIVLKMFLITNDVDVLDECGFLRNDINRLRIEF